MGTNQTRTASKGLEENIGRQSHKNERGLKTMKKVLSTVLALCLCCCLVLPAAADEAESETVTKLLLQVKEVLQVDDDLFEFDRSYSSQWDGETVYEFSWNAKEENELGRKARIAAAVYEDGTFQRYTYSDGLNDDVKVPVYSKEEAKEAAVAFVKQIAPEKADHLLVKEVSNGYEAYAVTFDREHDGVPVYGNQVTVSIDANTRKPVAFNSYNWIKELEFEDQENVLSLEDAQAAYREKAGFELCYRFFYNDREPSAKLVYQNKYTGNYYIDAKTGEVKQVVDSLTLRKENASTGGGSAQDNGAAKLTPEEQAVVDEIAKNMSKEKAIEIAMGIEELKLDATYTCTSYNVSQRPGMGYEVNLHFSPADKEQSNKAFYSVTLNAQTGELTAFSTYLDADVEEEEAKVSYEEGKKTAEAFLNKYQSDKMDQVQPEAVLKQEGTTYSYDRIVNGIRAKGNGFTLSIDVQTGEIRSYNMNWFDTSFETPAAAAAVDGLYEKAFANKGFSYVYLPVASGDEDAQIEAVPAYVIGTGYQTYDAKTLDKLDGRGLPATEEPTKYTDVDGHYAQPYVEKLLEMGIYLPGEVLHPDAGITQAEYLGLVLKATQNWYVTNDTDQLYRYCYSAQILTPAEKAPGAIVTRADGIRYLINAMGYKEVAGFNEIYQTGFADVPQDLIGYAALAGAFQLVSTKTDQFNPDNELTRADAMIMTYNYLAR